MEPHRVFSSFIHLSKTRLNNDAKLERSEVTR